MELFYRLLQTMKLFNLVQFRIPRNFTTYPVVQWSARDISWHAHLNLNCLDQGTVFGHRASLKFRPPKAFSRLFENCYSIPGREFGVQLLRKFEVQNMNVWPRHRRQRHYRQTRIPFVGLMTIWQRVTLLSLYCIELHKRAERHCRTPENPAGLPCA